jgi:3-hydroxybutyryl-CoA dehydratase
VIPAQGRKDDPMTTGIYWEDHHVEATTVTAARTIEGWDVGQFAGLTGDFNPTHTDAEFAAASPFGARVAHGLLTLSISAGLQNQTGIFAGTVLAFVGIDELRFVKPVFFGDTVSARMTVRDKRETSRPDRGLVRFAVEVVNQRGDAVLTFTQTLLVTRRPT